MKFLIIAIAALMMIATAQCHRYQKIKSLYDGKDDNMDSKPYGKSDSSYKQPKPSYGKTDDDSDEDSDEDSDDNMGSKPYGKSDSSYKRQQTLWKVRLILQTAKAFLWKN